MSLQRSQSLLVRVAAAIAMLAATSRGDETVCIESVLLELIEQSDVPARDPGVIDSLAVNEGDLVGKGEVVASLDPLDAQIDVERATLELRIAQQESKNDVDVRFAKKSLEVAQAELRRAQDSVEDYAKSVSQTELDRLSLAVERKRLEIEQADHVLNVARLTAELKQNLLRTAQRRLERLTIRAPIDGVVAQVYRDSGEWVEPGQPVVRVLRTDRLQVEGFVSASMLGRLSIGAAVDVSVALDDEKAAAFAGKLVYISPEVDPVNNQVRIRAEIDNPEMQLRPGMRGTMTIETAPMPLSN